MSQDEEREGHIKLAVHRDEIPKDHLVFKDEDYGERHFLRDGHGYKEVTNDPIEPVYVRTARGYTMNDAASFTTYVNKYGNSTTGIVFYNNTCVTMFFDERKRNEFVYLPLNKSTEAVCFFGEELRSKDSTQKEFVELLALFSECVDGYEKILPLVERIKVDTTIEFESSVDPRNIKLMYVEKAGNQTAEIPKEIKLIFPYFEGSKNKIEVMAKFEIKAPKEAGAMPVFSLSDPRYERTKRNALNAEMESLKKELPKWMFVNGE